MADKNIMLTNSTETIPFFGHIHSSNNPRTGRVIVHLPVQPNQSCDKKEESSAQYKEHEFFRQIVTPLARAVSGRIKAEGLFRFHFSRYYQNPLHADFSGIGGHIYKDNNALGKAMRHTMVPAQYRNKSHLSAKELLKLEKSGQSLLSAGKFIEQGMSIYWLVNEGVLLAECLNGEECSNTEIASIAADMSYAGLDIASNYSHIAGTMLNRANHLQSAHALLATSKQLFKGFGIARMVSGGVRVYITLEDYKTSDHLKGAKLAYGCSDVIGGAVNTIFAQYLLRESRKAMTIGIWEANKILLSDATRISPFMGSLRVFGGLASTGIGVGINTYGLYKTMNADTISFKQYEHQMFSHSLGTVGWSISALAMVPLYFNPVVTPFIIVVGALGAIIIVAQAVYDMHYISSLSDAELIDKERCTGLKPTKTPFAFECSDPNVVEVERKAYEIEMPEEELNKLFSGDNCIGFQSSQPYVFECIKNSEAIIDPQSKDQSESKN